MKSNPVRIFNAIFVAIQFLLGGSALADLVDAKVIGLLMLVMGAVQVGVGEYVRNQVTPWNTVVSKVNEAGTIVAGPASQVTTGAPVEEPVAQDVPPTPGTQ